jgi:hypothetical protein
VPASLNQHGRMLTRGFSGDRVRQTCDDQRNGCERL